MFWIKSHSLFSLIFLFIFSSCNNQEWSNESAIRQRAESYEQAFNRGDAKSLASLWSEDATYVNPESGEVISGRKAIEELFTSNFQEQKGSQIELKIDSINFPTSNQAVENGIAIVTQRDGLVNQTAYKALYEKRNGEWLITQVREVEFIDPPQQYEHLKGLEWLIGEWVDEDDDVTIKATFQWDKYKNFITQQFSVAVEGKLDLEGKQIIVWDPINEKIRSWVFDSDGGFGEAVWKKLNDSWVVETSNTLADGRRASSINIYTPINPDEYKWESTSREVDGELLPNIEPTTVVRIKK